VEKIFKVSILLHEEKEFKGKVFLKPSVKEKNITSLINSKL